MTLVLTDDQQLLRDTAQQFAADRAPPGELRRLRDTNDAVGFDRAVWKEMADMGWAGVLIPEDHGGVGFGHVGAGLIAQQIGRNLSVTPMLSTAVVGATTLLAGGSAAQKSLLPQIAAGDLVLAAAFDERPRHAPLEITTRAVRSGTGYALSGRKTHVLDGHVADHLIVSARLSGETGDRDGLALFLVNPRAPGVSIERVTAVDSHNTAIVELRDVAVAAGDVLPATSTAQVIEAALDAGRAWLAAEMLGIAEEAFERTLGYLREREQFGVLIGSFQALQHRAAYLYCEIELLRSAVLRALQALDAAEQGAAKLVCVAKARACEVARLATNEAVQMHGGIGMTDEFDIGFFMKRARAAAETFGDQYYHTDRFAGLAGY
ncbi:MAG TPA: acyl-CoA dehydrogenase [Povalibacter sp.]|nr:acyl-CoA dehydrogenase [Povalibacter sp.]